MMISLGRISVSISKPFATLTTGSARRHFGGKAGESISHEASGELPRRGDRLPKRHVRSRASVRRHPECGFPEAIGGFLDPEPARLRTPRSWPRWLPFQTHSPKAGLRHAVAMPPLPRMVIFMWRPSAGRHPTGHRHSFRNRRASQKVRASALIGDTSSGYQGRLRGCAGFAGLAQPSNANLRAIQEKPSANPLPIEKHLPSPRC